MSFTVYKHKPRARRAESITQTEIDVHHWLARLAVVLSQLSADPDSAAMRRHARKTLDEFCDHEICSDRLAEHVRDTR